MPYTAPLRIVQGDHETGPQATAPRAASRVADLSMPAMRSCRHSPGRGRTLILVGLIGHTMCRSQARAARPGCHHSPIGNHRAFPVVVRGRMALQARAQRRLISPDEPVSSAASTVTSSDSPRRWAAQAELQQQHLKRERFPGLLRAPFRGGRVPRPFLSDSARHQVARHPSD
jgi:hypothetical protein